MTLWRTMIVTWGIVFLAFSSSWAHSLVAAVLPSSRSVEVGRPATAFATIINAGQELVTDCRISAPSGLPATFFDVGLVDTWDHGLGADISPGAAHNFAFGFIPHGPMGPTDLQLTFECANTEPAPVFPGVNTFLLSASPTPVADIVAMAATPSEDGIVKIDGLDRPGVFVVATVNLGADDTVTVSADTGEAILPISLSICQTDPTTSVCLSPPESRVTTTILFDETPTFGIFVTVAESVQFIPELNRIFVRFRDGDGVTRGSTSVAVQAFICVPDPWWVC